MVQTNLGIDEGFVHPFAGRLEELALDYTLKMTEQAREKGVTLINVYELFAGHHSRFDDPTSPAYVRRDPTYWAYMAEINALGNEVVADVMLHILNTGQKTYHRKHSDTFLERALESEFDGTYGY
jgi:sugar phosphate isomerase/epimerase